LTPLTVFILTHFLFLNICKSAFGFASQTWKAQFPDSVHCSSLKPFMPVPIAHTCLLFSLAGGNA